MHNLCQWPIIEYEAFITPNTYTASYTYPIQFVNKPFIIVSGKSGYRYLWSWIESGVTQTNLTNQSAKVNFYNNYISKSGEYAECDSNINYFIILGY